MLITPLNYSFKNIFFEELWLFEEVLSRKIHQQSLIYFTSHSKGKWVKKKTRDKKCPLYRIEKDILI